MGVPATTPRRPGSSAGEWLPRGEARQVIVLSIFSKRPAWDFSAFASVSNQSDTSRNPS